MEFRRKVEDMARAGIAVELGRLCHAHPVSGPQGGNVFVGQSLY
jgi:hypothetical protein